MQAANTENRLREIAYFTQFAGDHDFESDADAPCNLFTGNPPAVEAANVESLEDRIARRVVEMLEEGGFLRLTRKTAPPIPQPPSTPRQVPTPAPRPVLDSPKAIIQSLENERLNLRSLWYQPSVSLKPRWEGIVDDGEGGEHPHIRIWIWEEDKQKVLDAGYSESIFGKTVTRFMLKEPIPVTIKWTDASGAKLDTVLTKIEVTRRAM